MVVVAIVLVMPRKRNELPKDWKSESADMDDSIASDWTDAQTKQAAARIHEIFNIWGEEYDISLKLLCNLSLYIIKIGKNKQKKVARV